MSDEPGALLTLARRMSSFAPPSLTVLIASLSKLDDYKEFLRIVKEFLPERETEILSETTPANQIARFASYFEDRYFPLWEYYQNEEAEGYDEIVRGIPVIIRGLSYSDYDEVASSWRSGAQLMTYLVESPYEEGARIAIGEACKEIVPVELLQKVPEKGFSMKELHQLLDGTPHAALGIWADIWFQNTGNPFLDIDEEMFGYSELPEWDRENVEGLTNDWQQADRLDQGVAKMRDWLEEKPAERFGELLDFILKRKERHGSDN